MVGDLRDLCRFSRWYCARVSNGNWPGRFAKDCATGIDGETYDPARVALICAVVVFLFLEVYTCIYQNKPFDGQAFGIGFGALLAAGGWGIKVKASTEPPYDPRKANPESPLI